MATDPSKRWGDPKWTMRRSTVFGVFGFLAFLLIFAFFWPPEKIDAIGRLLASMAFIITPVLLAYLGIPEIKEIRGAPAGSTTTVTSSVEKVVVPAPPPKESEK